MMGYDIIIRFVPRFGGYSLEIKSGKKTVYKHEFYFVDENNAMAKAKRVIRRLEATKKRALEQPNKKEA